MPFTRPPIIRLPRRPIFKSGGGPPLPPTFLLRGYGGAGGQRWQLILLLILGALTLALGVVGLASTILRFPLPACAALCVTAIRHRRVYARGDRPDLASDPNGALWAIVVAAAGFLLSQLPTPPVGVGMLVIGALGLGGAAGLFTWGIAIALLPALDMTRLTLRLLRRGG